VSAAPGTDIAFSDSKVASYRAFANKIWNAGRFILMNLRTLPRPVIAQLADALAPLPGTGYEPVPGAAADRLADAWIFSRLATVTREMDRALGEYRFHEAAAAIYHFFWHEFCDWYVEWVKPGITRTAASPELAETVAIWMNLLRAFDASLHLLHPLMPFITEELWHRLPHARAEASISLGRFDLASERASNPVAEKQFQAIQELVVAARNAKAEEGLQTARPSAQVASVDLRLLELFREYQEAILRLAGLAAMNFERRRMPPGPGVVPVSPSLDLRLLAEKAVDRAAERARLLKEKSRLEQHLKSVEGQLQNDQFLHRAPAEVVRGAKERRTELTELLRKINESLNDGSHS
jgi:valyl-tRNA synthetase